MNVELFYFINNGLSNPILDVILPNITELGGFESLGIICLIALIITRKNFYGLGKFYPLVKLCAVSLIVTTAIVFCLKVSFRHPRPYMVLDHVNVLAQTVDPNSFPSGHTSSTLSIVTVLVIKSKEYFEKYRLINGILIIFALLIALSRIYVGLHYPIDVMVGGLVATAVGILVCRYLKV